MEVLWEQARPTSALRCSAVTSWEEGIIGSSGGSVRSQPVAGADGWTPVNKATVPAPRQMPSPSHTVASLKVPLLVWIGPEA